MFVFGCRLVDAGLSGSFFFFFFFKLEFVYFQIKVFLIINVVFVKNFETVAYQTQFDKQTFEN